MRIAQDMFQGVVPRTASHRLAPSQGQDATNAKLLSGDLEAWRQFAALHTLATAPPVKSIYLLGDKWLSWGADVDAARGPIPGDTTMRLYLTGPDVYSQPQFTDYTMATTGAEPYPVLTRPLGVPAPEQHARGDDTFITFLALIYVPASGDEPSTVTEYLYTYVNDLGQESAPSLPEAYYHNGLTGRTYPVYTPTPGGSFNELEIYPVPPALDSYGIVSFRLYRAATGATGTAFRFVLEAPFNSGGSVTLVVDNITDDGLGEVLPTSDWDLPPADLRGILALPNGVMAGFSGNQLCLSAQNYPHAWPVANRYTTDTDVVGIGNIDTTVVIFTESFIYVATGTDPGQYSMAKFEVPYAGVSKRSVGYVDGVGVVGATPDGLRAVAGVGQSLNLTKQLFTRKQWQALKPESMTGIAHDGVYFLFYDTGTAKGCYAFDMSQGGAGVTPMAFHASAVFADPETDNLCLVLDENDEPTDGLLPAGSTAVPADGQTIYEFDSPDSGSLMVYRYRSKLNILGYEAAFIAAQVRCADFDNVVWRVYGNGSMLFEQQLTTNTEFTMPEMDTQATLEIEFVGTSTVRNVQVAEDMQELV
jgi:hypothetical protein